MSLLTDFYHRLPTGQQRRIALAPLVCMDELRDRFGDLALHLCNVSGGDSYLELWRSSLKFRGCVDGILELNGLKGWGLPLGDIVALCVGSTTAAPLLGQYNLITDELAPKPNSHPIAPPLGEPPAILTKRMGDVFPCWDVGGSLLYPKGVAAARHGEFEAVYGALVQELGELQEAWAMPHPAIALLWSDEVRALALRMVELFGLPSDRLNIHQVCELAIAYRDEPGLLPQLAGLVDFADAPPQHNSTHIPNTKSPVHFLAGALAYAGVKDWESLVDGMTMQELEAYQQGMGWAMDGGESERKRRNAIHRDAVFSRHFGENGTGVPPIVERLRQRGRVGL